MCFFTSAGAIYSSSSDLYALGRSILSNTLLSPVKTPCLAQTPYFHLIVWHLRRRSLEIARATNITGGDGHIVDFYTKGGNLDLYSSQIALVPDYNLVFAVTSARPDTSEGLIQVLLSQIMTAPDPCNRSCEQGTGKEDLRRHLHYRERPHHAGR